MQDFETREVQIYDELKQQLETCYQTKQSICKLNLIRLNKKQMNSARCRTTRRPISYETI